jgi:DNA polymerase III subunit alpha
VSSDVRGRKTGGNESDKITVATVGVDCAHDHKGPIMYRRARRVRSVVRDPKLVKPMRFVSLHHHTTYSYGDGFQMPEAHVRRCTELNMRALAVTEHGNTSSWVKLEIAAQAAGIKPIFGCEVYMGETDIDKRSQIKNHLTVLARSQEGHRNLLNLVTRSFAEGFYYHETVSPDMLEQHRSGLVVLSGCTGSELFTALAGGKHVPAGQGSYKAARAVAKRFKEIFGDNYFIEVQAFPELEVTRAANPLLARIAAELKIPLVATMDCHYTVLTESEMQKVLHNVRGGSRQTLEEQERAWGYDVPLCPPPDDRSILNRLKLCGLTHSQAVEAVLNTEEIAQSCNVVLPKLERLRFPDLHGKTSQEVWREWIRQGWKKRGIDRLSSSARAEYKARLKREVDVIEDKDFTDYFLVVADCVQWAKRTGIAVGPARGSAAASLVCWLLQITEVNPIQFPNLVFERFIDVSRQDLPDIDLDFDSRRRHEIREYLVSKYGADRVTNIGTFSTYKAKLALDDVARVYRVPRYKVEEVKSRLIERSSGDLRASATIEDTIDQFETAREVFDQHPDLGMAIDLEGNVKGFGVHAAGLVVSNAPIKEICAVYSRVVNGRVLDVLSLDKYDAERQGLIKMDFLGLSTMAVIAEATERLGFSLESLYNMPLDDPDVMAGFQRNDVVGIFQFDGRATRWLNGAIKPDDFSEICDINALSRPGPLHNGAAVSYIQIKRGLEEPELIHPAYDAISAPTKSQVVYQEQILRIVREIGDFDWTHASYIRKIISRKLGEQEFNRQKDAFVEGAQRLHADMDQATAERIWGVCVTAGSYAFNLAHCVAYGMLAYWTMWLKVNHPAVFYAASLRNLPDTRTGELLRDAHRHGIKISPPDPQVSTSDWEPVGDDRIAAGLTQVPGIGAKTAERMIELRESGQLGTERSVSWSDFSAVRGVGPKTIQRIAEFSADEDPFGVLTMERRFREAKRFIESQLHLPNPTHDSDTFPDTTDGSVEIVWLGMLLARNLRNLFEVNWSKTGVALDPDTVKDPHLAEWIVGTGMDEEGSLGLKIDRWRYPAMRKAIWNIKLEHDIVLFQGVKPHWQNLKQLQVTRFWVLEV